MKNSVALDVLGNELRPGNLVAIARYSEDGIELGIIERFSFDKKGEMSRIYFIQTGWKSYRYITARDIGEKNDDLLYLESVTKSEALLDLNKLVKQAVIDGRLPKGYKLGVPIGTKEAEEEKEEEPTTVLSGVSLLRGE
jgi:hypothetical protein